MNLLLYKDAWGNNQFYSLAGSFTEFGLLILISRLINAGATNIEVSE